MFKKNQLLLIFLIMLVSKSASMQAPAKIANIPIGSKFFEGIVYLYLSYLSQ